MSYAIRLDFPPSVNTYYRRSGHIIYLSDSGRKYKKETASDVLRQFPDAMPLTGRLGVQIELAAPNSVRDTDIDNRIKSVLDSLEGLLFEDDRQIDELIVRRLPIAPPGHADVIISELTAAEPQWE